MLAIGNYCFGSKNDETISKIAFWRKVPFSRKLVVGYYDFDVKNDETISKILRLMTLG